MNTFARIKLGAQWGYYFATYEMRTDIERMKRPIGYWAVILYPFYIIMAIAEILILIPALPVITALYIVYMAFARNVSYYELTLRDYFDGKPSPLSVDEDRLS